MIDIHPNEVRFKSYPINFKKEASGLKNNTIREIDLNDQRFIKLISWATLNEYVDKWIVIINSEHHNTSFAREIKDISFYKNFLIITWESKI